MAGIIDELQYLNSLVESEFEHAITGAPEDRLTELWYGDWSLREIALHLATWDEIDSEQLELIAGGAVNPPHRWSGPEETDSLNAKLVSEHTEKSWDAVAAYAMASRERLRRAIEGLRGVPEERFWERGSLLAARARHSAVHRTHHLLPILEWRKNVEA